MEVLGNFWALGVDKGLHLSFLSNLPSFTIFSFCVFLMSLLILSRETVAGAATGEAR